MGVPSQEEQSKIQGERALSDLELVKGEAEFKEAGRIEATGEQVKAAKKEMETEKKSESPEIKSLEELKTRAQEAGASPEDIKVLKNKLEQARDGGEAFISKKEEEYNKARLQERELEKSLEMGGAIYKKAENRKARDIIISGVAFLGAGAIFAGGATGVLESSAIWIPVLSGLTAGGLAMAGAPIARIKNWFERRKVKKEILKTGEEKKKAFSEYKEARFGK